MEKKYLLLCGYSLFFISGVLAQQTTLTAGDNANGVGGFVSYSIGPLFYTTNFGESNFSSTQGVEQPFEVFTTHETSNFKDILLSFSAYPNPTVDFLTLTSPNYLDYNLNYSLYDVNGKILLSKKIHQKTT